MLYGIYMYMHFFSKPFYEFHRSRPYVTFNSQTSENQELPFVLKQPFYRIQAHPVIK